MSESSPGDPDAIVSQQSRDRSHGGGAQQPNNTQGRGAQQGNKKTKKFVGKEEAIKEHIYDISSFKANKKYTTTTREIAEYAARTYPQAGEFRQALQRLRFDPLTSPPFTPQKADAPTFQEQEEWKLKYREFHDKQVKREDNSKKVFALILGQCSQALLHRMEANTTYEAVDSSNDPIQLLKLIRGCIYQRNTTRKAVHSYIDAEIALHNF